MSRGLGDVYKRQPLYTTCQETDSYGKTLSWQNSGFQVNPHRLQLYVCQETAMEKCYPGKILGSRWTPIGYSCMYAKKLTAMEKHHPGKILGSKLTPIGYSCTYAKKLTAMEKHCPGKILGSRLPTIWAASANQWVANNILRETSNEWLPCLPSKAKA